MTWNEARLEVLKEILAKENLKYTEVSEKSGFSRNFLTVLLTGKKKSLLDDEIEAMAPQLKTTTAAFLGRVIEKKTNQRGERYMSAGAQAS